MKMLIWCVWDVQVWTDVCSADVWNANMLLRWLCRLLLDATTYHHLSRGQFYHRGQFKSYNVVTISVWDAATPFLKIRVTLVVVVVAEYHHWTTESCSHVKIPLVNAAKSSLTSSLSRDVTLQDTLSFLAKYLMLLDYLWAVEQMTCYHSVVVMYMQPLWSIKQ